MADVGDTGKQAEEGDCLRQISGHSPQLGIPNHGAPSLYFGWQKPLNLTNHGLGHGPWRRAWLHHEHPAGRNDDHLSGSAVGSAFLSGGYSSLVENLLNVGPHIYFGHARLITNAVPR